MFPDRLHSMMILTTPAHPLLTVPLAAPAPASNFNVSDFNASTSGTTRPERHVSVLYVFSASNLKFNDMARLKTELPTVNPSLNPRFLAAAGDPSGGQLQMRRYYTYTHVSYTHA